MVYEVLSDPYCYKGTTILKNKYAIINLEELKNLEKQLVTNKNHQLLLQPILGNFDFDHLKSIHKFLFEDLYPFAGLCRNINFSKGDTEFCRFLFIENYAKGLFNDFQKEDFESYDKKKFISRLAFYMSDVNMLHPFREGNGRTTREFFRLFCLYHNWVLDFDNRSSEIFLKAMIESVTDSKLLEQCLSNSIKRLFTTKTSIV